ncbi:MAG: Ni/Fe-hydrogenase, b-type cytochrome subunit [Selenomonadaceae bacterium]|nr:Ni/Fe-hydrogenase, b-type cytochrome subunit [Selenomonadaceae bacterium]
MDASNVSVVQRRIYYLFSPFLRIFHWIMVDCICVLFVTGILIGKPLEILNFEPSATYLLMNVVRDLHFLAAFLLCASFVLKVYGFIINKGDRLFPRFWEGHFYMETIDVALHYMLLKKSHKSYLRNPLARMSYAFLYVLVAVEVFTGFAMYLMVNPDSVWAFAFSWVNTVLGSEFMTHLVHHYVAWAIILFASGHLYMVTRAEFMEGESEVSSMFSGSKVLVHVPTDVKEIM